MIPSLAQIRTGRTNPVLLSSVLACSCAIVWLAVFADLEPFELILCTVAIVLTIALSFKYPLLSLCALLFVGILKSKPAEGVSVTDPTIIVFGLVVLILAVRILFASARLERLTVFRFLAGQGSGVALYILFVSIVAASFLYAPSTAYGYSKILRLWTLNLVLLLAPLFLVTDEADFRRLTATFVVFALLLSALTLLSVFSVIDFGTEMDAAGQARTRIGEAWMIGSATLILLYFNFGGRLGRWAAFVGIPFLTLCLVASLARGPLVTLLVVLSLSLLMIRRNVGPISRRSIALGIVGTVMLAGVALVWIHQVPSAQSTLLKKESETTALLKSGDPGGTAGMRLTYYKAALVGFVEKPLLGWGVGAWPIYYGGTDRRAYPHNIILETAFEQGMLGLIALFLFLAALFAKARWLLYSADGRYTFLFPTMLFCFGVTMFSGDINSNALWFWSGMVFAASRLVAQKHTSVIKAAKTPPVPTISQKLAHEILAGRRTGLRST